LFEKYLSRFGIEFSFVDAGNLEAWRKAIQSNTELLFLETPSNPLIEVFDIAAVASIAKEKNCRLVVDNCFCTPVLQKPLDLGADIVVHSATKYIDGQGRCLGGAVVGDTELVGEQVFGFLRTAGPSMSPFNAWVFLKGLETLGIRMRAHSKNAMALAQWLLNQSAVSKVYYPGLTTHPQHALASRQQLDFGGILAFEVKGGKQQAWQVVDATQVLSITANLGDAKTTITHPATTTHGRWTDEARAAAGIGDNLLRVSVGLEDVEDIQDDLARGLSALK
jgi:O-succinylhomoserine sulfhydrylase